MQVLELYVIRRAVGKEGFFLVGQRTDLFYRAAHVEETAFQALAGRYQAAGADDHVIFHHRAIHDDAAHADQDPATHGATVEHDFVSDCYVLADQQREAIRIERAGMGDVQYTAVLNTGTRAHTDAMHVATDHRQRPDRAVFADFNVADHHRRTVDKSAFAKQRRVILILAKGHDRLSLFC